MGCLFECRLCTCRGEKGRSGSAQAKGNDWQGRRRSMSMHRGERPPRFRLVRSEPGGCALCKGRPLSLREKSCRAVADSGGMSSVNCCPFFWVVRKLFISAYWNYVNGDWSFGVVDVCCVCVCVWRRILAAWLGSPINGIMLPRSGFELSASRRIIINSMSELT